ncbi:helix-turn-helix domain-containing protein [Oceanibaculum nanhaiense]|uniref:helix-turn-helix domain-containing protein n=1 Tax=Oceanibaculum nanhaiense TaxID=1909734 RepID=UPI00396D06EB
MHFDTDHLEPQVRHDAWQDNLGGLFDMSRPDGRSLAPDVRAKIDACNLGGVILGTTRSQTQLFQRDAGRVARDDMDHILVQVFLEGGGISGGEQVIGAGDMLVIDLDQPHHMVNSDFENLTMLLPRELAPSLSDLLAPLHGRRLGFESPMVRFMSEHMLAFWRHVPEMTTDQAAGALEGTIGLLQGWLSRDAPLAGDASPAVSAAVGKAVCRFIDRHLAEPLSPERLAAEFRISRSHIYRMFAPYGGVARYVAERRLRRSLRMLTQPLFDRMSIGALGFACGFSSESHFSRAFRTHYGMSPSEARAAARDVLRESEPESGSTDGEFAEFAAWIHELRR